MTVMRLSVPQVADGDSSEQVERLVSQLKEERDAKALALSNLSELEVGALL